MADTVNYGWPIPDKTQAQRGEIDKIATSIVAADAKVKTIDAALAAHIVTFNAHTHSFASLTGKPTTLAGYGITDAYTKTVVDTNIAAAVAALVASSPAALDTLNEFAAALGNDPNFSATILAAVGLKSAKANNLSDLADLGAAVANLFAVARTVADDRLLFGDPVDPTKRVRLDAGNVTAGQTRVLAMPDVNVSIHSAAVTFLAAANDAAQRTALGFDTMVDEFSGIILVPVNGVYHYCVKVPFDGEIVETTTQCASGTCTATFGVSGVTIPGAANAVSSASVNSQVHTGATFVAGNYLSVTVSALAAALNMTFTTKVLRKSH